MKTKKSMSAPRSTKSRSKSSKGSESASSMVLQLIGGVVGDSLAESVSNLKSKVTEQVSIHGQEYLDSARERITDATAQVFEWGKKHPVKTVAAAAALIAVSGFLYATMHGSAGQIVKKSKAKLKAASARG